MLKLIQKNSLTVRLLTEADAPLLTCWLSDPRVLEFYSGRDRPYDLEQVREHFYVSESVTRCIVEWNGQAIGYLQFYPVEPESKTLYGYPTNECLWGMDQFIGEPDYWNRGIGTQLVQAIASYLLNLGAAGVVMDPEAWNQRALRAYEKAGFKKVKLLPKHEMHEGEWRDCWLMEFVKPPG